MLHTDRAVRLDRAIPGAIGKGGRRHLTSAAAQALYWSSFRTV